MIEYIETYSGALSFFSSFVLVCITFYYAYITRKILKTTSDQVKNSLNPVIGIEIEDIKIGKVFGKNRRNMGIELKLTNVGNAPAIEVLVDADIELRYSAIDGDNIIPARFEPEVISFIEPFKSISVSSNFGNTLVTHFFDDVRESTRLNLHRIEMNPSQQSYKTSKLTIKVYYRNSLGQFYQSIYKTEIDIFSKINEDPIPKPDEICNVTCIYIPRPSFHANPINEDNVKMQIDNMNKIRNKSGW